MHPVSGAILLSACKRFHSTAALKMLFFKQLQAMVNGFKTAGSRFE
jgi:hypothetical protein